MKKTPLFTSRYLFIVIFTSYKVQTPHYFFDFWRFLARERLRLSDHTTSMPQQNYHVFTVAGIIGNNYPATNGGFACLRISRMNQICTFTWTFFHKT